MTSRPHPPTEAAPGLRPRVVAGVALLVALAFAGWLAVNTYLGVRGHGHSLGRIFVYHALVHLYWALAAPGIALLAHRLPLVPWRGRAVLAHTAAGLALAAGQLAWLLQAMIWLRPYGAMGATTFSPHFRHLLREQLPLAVLTYAGIVAVLSAALQAKASRARALRDAELERQLVRARLSALDGQLQPHFLFNALNTVASLVRGGDDQAAVSTLAQLSDLLRYSLAASGAPLVPLRDELAALGHYLAIQKLRFGERLRVDVEVAPEALAASVPRLLLQPLVENAVSHGVAASPAGGWLELQAARRDDRLALSIRNGAAPDRGGESGHGIGLRNVRARLAHLYGDGCDLRVERLPDRFTVAVDIPWQGAGDEEAGDG